jgi:hypothetical protein
MSKAKYAFLTLGLIGAACGGPSPEDIVVETTAGKLTLPINVTDPTSVVPLLRTAPTVLATSYFAYTGSDGLGYCTRLFTKITQPTTIGGYDYVWERVPIAQNRCDWASSSAAIVDTLNIKAAIGNGTPMNLKVQTQGLFQWNPISIPTEVHQSLQFSYLNSTGGVETMRLPGRLALNVDGFAKDDNYFKYMVGGVKKCVRAIGNQYVIAPTTTSTSGLCNWFQPFASSTLSYTNPSAPSQTLTATFTGTTFNPTTINYLSWENQLSRATLISYALPAGSYTATCSGITYDGVRLAGTCAIPIGGVAGAALDDYGICVNQTPATTTNVWGSLSCYQNIASSSSGPFISGEVPPGSYLQSCVMPRMSGLTLFARCLSSGFVWRDNAAPIGRCLPPNAAGDISNNNGSIACFL